MVDLVRAGRSPDELARGFEPSAQAIRNGVAQAERDEGRRQDGAGSVEREELAHLRRENRQLRLERDILAKVAAWFAWETGTIRSGSSNSKANEAVFPIRTLCRVLGVSPAGTTPGVADHHRHAPGPTRIC